MIGMNDAKGGGGEGSSSLSGVSERWEAHGLFRSYFSPSVEKLPPLRNRKSITSRNPGGRGGGGVVRRETDG